MARFLLIAVLLTAVSLVVDADTAASKDHGYVLDKVTHNKEEVPVLKLKDTLIKSSILDINDDAKNKDTKRVGVAVLPAIAGNKGNPAVPSKKQLKKNGQKKNSKKTARRKLKQFLSRPYLKRKQRRLRNNSALQNILNMINSHHKKGKGSTLSTKYLRGNLFKPNVWRNSKRRKGFPKRKKLFGSKRKGLKKSQKKQLRNLKNILKRNKLGNKVNRKGGKKGTQKKAKLTKPPKRKEKATRANRLSRFKGRLRALRRRFKGKGKGKRRQQKTNRKQKLVKKGKELVTKKRADNKISKQNRLNRFKGTVRALTKLLKGRKRNRLPKKGKKQLKKERPNKTNQNRLNSYKGRTRAWKRPVKGKGKKKNLKGKQKEQKPKT